MFKYYFSLLFQLSVYVYGTVPCVLLSIFFSWILYLLWNNILLPSSYFCSLFLLLHLYGNSNLLWNHCVINISNVASINKYFIFWVVMVTCISKWHFCWLKWDYFSPQTLISWPKKKPGCKSECHQKNAPLRKQSRLFQIFCEFVYLKGKKWHITKTENLSKMFLPLII